MARTKICPRCLGMGELFNAKDGSIITASTRTRKCPKCLGHGMINSKRG
jgi:DnaJ-class molecular chaperone